MFFIPKAASEFSHAFSTSSGLAEILSGLESSAAPVRKPMARKAFAKAKAKAQAKVKASVAGKKVKQVATTKACPPAPAASQSADALGDPKAAGGRALKDTKKDVHSRAYHAALRKAKKAGTDPAECKKLASKAGSAAAAEWDKAHP